MRLLATLILFTASAVADCIPFSEAASKLGYDVCVTGKVLKVYVSRSGTQFLDFCDQPKECPFTVVVFATDLREVGDIRLLAGKTIEIHGKVRQYNGRAEIILRTSRQLRGEAAHLPAAPRDYDADVRGRYSAGSLARSKSAKKQKKGHAPSNTAVSESDVMEDREEVPADKQPPKL